MSIVRQGSDCIEIRALVIRDIGSVVAEKIPASLRDQGEEPLIAERAAINWSTDIGSHSHALLADLVGVLVGTSPEDGRDLVAGGGQRPDEPRPCERAPTGKENLHD